MNLQDLKKVIPYKWKIQSFVSNETKGTCVAYIDARNVMDLLDEVCGPDNWQDEYKEIHGRLVAGIGIKTDNGWVWKWDTGVSGDYEEEKSEFSDSFKRAAVKWGVGRFLYSMDIQWVNVLNKKPIDENGNRIWDLTKYIEDRKSPVPQNKVSMGQLLKTKKLIDELGLQDMIIETLAKWNYTKLEDLPDFRLKAILTRLKEVKQERSASV